MERTLTWIAACAAALVAAAFPIAYYLFGQSSLDATLRTEVEINARLATRIVNANPELWQFEATRLEELLARRPADGTRESRIVRDLGGVEIAASVDPLPPPLRTHSAPVMDSGRAVGHIAISRSLQPLLVGTGTSALLGVLLAAVLFYALRTLPLRSLRGALDALVAERERAFSLRRERDAAEFAARMKSEFLARMSHEIRTPMNGVLGMTELLLASALDERQRRFAQTAYSSGTALLKIIDDILDFSKIDAGKLELERVSFSPLELTEDIVQMMAPRAFGKGLDIGVRIAPDVPDRIEGDPGRTRQVLTNLLGNAVKFTEQGEVCVALDLIADAEGRPTRLRFAVRDSGIGIAPAAVARLFDPFVQADSSTTRRFGGTGLGLAISRQLALAMGGELTAQSSEGEGSTFTFALPLIGASIGPPAPGTLPAPRIALVHCGELSARAVHDALVHIGVAPDMFHGEMLAPMALREAAAGGHPYALVLLGPAFKPRVAAELAERIAQACGRAPPALLHMQPMTGTRAPAQAGSTESEVLHVPARSAELRAMLLRFGARFAAADRTPPRSRERNGLRGRRVLVVEDNPVNQLVAAGMLESMGVHCTVAADGAGAFAQFEAHEFDLVLMDCQMPGMDGFETTRRIRAAEQGAGGRQIIVALTANASGADRARCIDAGMDDFLSKPMTADTLRAMLERWLVSADAPAA